MPGKVRRIRSGAADSPVVGPSPADSLGVVVTDAPWGSIGSRRFVLFCYSLPVSSSAVPQVRHELALIAVGCLVVADIYCRR
ncbi:Ms4533A family Cys-rich leader peptide [Nocardia miyunensis]|uniref:Ms4533A family Cys-rich leader peptide n=1 Tax=Nocardia miyunensis TaxID=282684 RepID=UPI00350E3FC0